MERYYGSLMAEPFLLRPCEIGQLTDYQIKVMIDAQVRMINSAKGDEQVNEQKEETKQPEPKVGDGAFVTPDEAAKFFEDLERVSNGRMP